MDEAEPRTRVGPDVRLDRVHRAVVAVAVDEDDLGPFSHLRRPADDVVDVAPFVLARDDHTAGVVARGDRAAASGQLAHEVLREREMPDPRKLRDVAVQERGDEGHPDGQ